METYKAGLMGQQCHDNPPRFTPRMYVALLSLGAIYFLQA